MKIILLILCVGILVWFGNDYYQQHKTKPFESPVTQNNSTTAPEKIESYSYWKCTTKDGRIIYGEGNLNPQCEKSERLKRSITIMPSKEMTLVDSASRAKPGAEPSAKQSVNPQESFSLNPKKYQCDGRVECNQMTSCDEAKYFLKNCPGVKMDGDNDGVPCEQQWCH